MLLTIGAWTPQEIRDHLVASADPVRGLTGICRANGRLNLRRAICGPFTIVQPSGGQRLQRNSLYDVEWRSEYDLPVVGMVEITIRANGAATVLTPIRAASRTTSIIACGGPIRRCQARYPAVVQRAEESLRRIRAVRHHLSAYGLHLRVARAPCHGSDQSIIRPVPPHLSLAGSTYIVTSRMNPLTDAGSIHRITTTRSFSGSTHVMLPPAPEAKKLCSVAFGYRVRPVFSHHSSP